MNVITVTFGARFAPPVNTVSYIPTSAESQQLTRIITNLQLKSLVPPWKDPQ